MTQELINKIESFLRENYREEIAELAERYPRDQKSLEIEWMDVFRSDPDIADDVLDAPEKLREYFEAAVANVDLPIAVKLDGVHVRFVNLHDSDRYQVGETRQYHQNRRLTLTGQITRTTPVKPRIEHAVFECQRCGTLTPIPQSGDELQEPHECQGCERQGPFFVNQSESELIDYQRARLQEPPEKSKSAEGATIDVTLTDDIVGEIQPGDRVDMVGILKGTQAKKKSRTYDPYLEGESMQVRETDFRTIDYEEYRDEIETIASGEYGDPYDLLVDSIAPTHKGDEEIKEAIGLQMFGGRQVEYPDGGTDRGDSHILMLGDPGTGKSSLLKAANNLAPRSVYASGKGASAAGLTAAAVPDDFGDEKWNLKAGALVLADRGIACIDEIDKVDEDAVASLHDALESQTVHVNKAGINAHLPARTALLAAGNPKYGRFDPYESYADQITLGPALLSRFDLLFTVSDTPEESRERETADHMIRSRRIASMHTDDPRSVSDDDLEEIEPAIPADVLRAYIALAKQEVTPKIQDDEVADSLATYFAEIRLSNESADGENAIPVTYRKLEAIERLAEASARVELRDEVLQKDIRRATHLVEKSMRDVGIDPNTGSFDADIINTGVSKTQQQRMDAIKSIIREAADSTGAADLDDVKRTAENEGYSPREAEQAVEKLKKYGDAYEVSEGVVRLV